jgi:hypothetical protein
MLKRALISVLVLLYSLTAIGMPLHFHYCKGELQHITLILRMDCHEQEPVEGQSCCKPTTAHCPESLAVNACCSDATQWLHEEVPAICSANILPEEGPDGYAVAHILTIAGHTPSGGSDMIPREPQSPGPDIPLYVAHCALIFYG